MSAEIQCKNTSAESNAKTLGEGDLVAISTKTLIISDFWKAPEVEGFADIIEGPSPDHEKIDQREYKALYAKACQV